MSPHLFSMYIDDLLVKLNKIKAGCYIRNALLNHILFADDLCCFSPSLDGLQLLVDACSEFAAENDLQLLSLIAKNLLAFYMLQLGKKFIVHLN